MVIGLGSSGKTSPLIAAAQANRLLKKLGDRTVYWVDNGTDTAVTTALRALTPHHPRVLVIAATDEPAIPAQRTSSDPPGARVVDRVVTAVMATSAGDAAREGECADGLGGYRAVPIADCEFATSRPNPRTCADSIRWALAQADQAPRWERKCLHFVARANGWSASGVRSAADYWAQAGDRHLDDANPPAGALVFWDTGKRDGHVALSVGNGTVVSTDIAGRGSAAAVALTTVSQRWNATYLGWTPPFFPHGV
ncbi:MAG: CHAP domain-containing protein [Sporichthyaceae bacterium]